MLDRRSFLRLIGFAPAAALGKPETRRHHGRRLPFTKSAEPRLASERSAVNCRHWSWNRKDWRYAHVSLDLQLRPEVPLSALCWRMKDFARRRAEATAYGWSIARGRACLSEEDEKVFASSKTCHAFETCDYFEEKP